MTEAVFRSLDHLSGGVAAHPEEADELRVENTVLRDRVLGVGGAEYRLRDEAASRSIRLALSERDSARAERDTARVTGTVGIR